MKIRRNYTEKCTLAEFAEKHDLTMVIDERERRNAGSYRFYCHFEGCEVKVGCMLEGAYGNGETEQEAMLDYAKAISGKTLRTDSGSGPLIHVPELTGVGIYE